MVVSYLEPVERAWERTRRTLFQPFDLERWLILGFAAFLAGLGSWLGLGFGPSRRRVLGLRADDLVRAPFEVGSDLISGSLWFAFGVPLFVMAVLVGVAFLWLSSRGKFVFLDGMIHGRGAIVDPWKRHAWLGDSLFLWRLGFTLVVLLAMALLVTPLVVIGAKVGDVLAPLGALIVLCSTLLAITIGIVVAYASLFLESFVVPLMFLRRCTASEAWWIFLPLLRARPLPFVVYGLVVLLGCLLLAMAVFASAIVTCCILPALLSLPYISSVILLPALGLYRLYGVEFLGQFGAEYALFGATAQEGSQEVAPPSQPPGGGGNVDGPGDPT